MPITIQINRQPLTGTLLAGGEALYISDFVAAVGLDLTALQGRGGCALPRAHV